MGLNQRSKGCKLGMSIRYWNGCKLLMARDDMMVDGGLDAFCLKERSEYYKMKEFKLQA